MNGNLKNLQSLTGKIKSFGIDTTLTKKGMCAESKAVGDALAAKVNISDIIDDLLSVASDKPLSANQGRLLKKLIDEIDPHYAENVLYNDTNVKDALDKVSKAENIVYDGDKSVQGAIDEVTRTLGYTMSNNLLKYPYNQKSHTNTGITWVDNGDGTLTANGTATGNAEFLISHRTATPFILPAGTYILSGCPKGGSDSTYYMKIGKTASDGTSYEMIGRDYGEGFEFTLTEETKLGISCDFESGYVANNFTFYPMINDAHLGKIPFVPYVADVQTQIKTVDEKVLTLARKEITVTTDANGNCSYGLPYGTQVINAFCTSHLAAGVIPIICAGSVLGGRVTNNAQGYTALANTQVKIAITYLE